MKIKASSIVFVLIAIGVLSSGNEIFGIYVAVSDYFKGDPAVPTQNEIVLGQNDWVEATTKLGIIKVRSGNGLRRYYSWDGITRSIAMNPRKNRWYGSYGLYFPGPGRHWLPSHNGISRGVLEEGQQHFKTTEEALKWIEQHQPLTYRDDGLAIYFTKNPSRHQLNVDVWQIYIDGRKPTKLPNSQNEAIIASWDHKGQ